MILSVENLYKNFGNTHAVKGLTFRISSGDITGFVGPNGAGKTTTLRILATIEDASSGNVDIDGRSIFSQPEAARELIGFVPDSLPVHTDMSVHEYLDFFARAYGIESKRRRNLINDLEEFTNLVGIREKLIAALSKGMKQRVSIARALINDPQFLLMDEPAAGLDPRARIELRELLRVLSRQGKGILISSHILSELAEICNAALIIEQGVLLKFGTIDEVTSHNQQTRRLILKPLSDLEALSKVMLLEQWVENLVVNGKFLECDYAGSDDEASNLLNRLIAGGHRLIEFRFKQQNLESVFMNITRGEVQ